MDRMCSVVPSHPQNTSVFLPSPLPSDGLSTAIEAQRQHEAERSEKELKLEQERQRILNERRQLVKELSGKGTLLAQVGRCLPVQMNRHSASAGVALLRDWQTDGVQQGQFFVIKTQQEDVGEGGRGGEMGESFVIARKVLGSRGKTLKTVFQLRPTVVMIPGNRHPNFIHPANEEPLRMFSETLTLRRKRTSQLHYMTLHCCESHYQKELDLLKRLSILENAAAGSADHIRFPKSSSAVSLDSDSGEESMGEPNGKHVTAKRKGEEKSSSGGSRGPDLELEIRALYDVASFSVISPLQEDHSPNSVSLLFSDKETLRRWRSLLFYILEAIQRTLPS